MGEDETRRSTIAAGILLGLGLGGFVDGIVTTRSASGIIC